MATVEQNTFSSIIDGIVTSSGRRDRRADMIKYCNATIREVQVQHYFDRDFVEDEVEPDGSDPYTMDKPDRIRLLRSVAYDGLGVVRNLPPGRIQEGVDHYYYGGSDYWVFVGASAVDTIKLAYYRYLPKLQYFASDVRPAVYLVDEDTGDGEWQYLSNGSYVDSLATEALELAAREKVTNWMITDWEHLVIEGTKTKVFQALADDRAKLHFSLYKEFNKNLIQGESFTALDF